MSKINKIILEEDYTFILNEGGRVEEIFGIYKEDEFLKDLEPYKEDLKIAKGFLIKFVLAKDIETIIDVYKCLKELDELLPESIKIIIGVYYEELETSRMNYEIIISGLPFNSSVAYIEEDN